MDNNSLNPSAFLDALKYRTVDVQRRLGEMQKSLAALQTQYQALAQEHASLLVLTKVTEAEIEQAKKETLSVEFVKLAGEIRNLPEPPSAIVLECDPITENRAVIGESINKTDMIRNLLRSNPAGISAVDLWKLAKPQIQHRPYFYSILNRLKDKEEVVLRRGKYLLKNAPIAKPEEGPKETISH